MNTSKTLRVRLGWRYLANIWIQSRAGMFSSSDTSACSQSFIVPAAPDSKNVSILTTQQDPHYGDPVCFFAQDFIIAFTRSALILSEQDLFAV